MPHPIIEVKNVSMRFNMAKEKVDSLKELFIRRAKGTLKFEEFFALSNVSLQVNKGDVYGLVGLNGSGKSTLLKIIAGVMKPTMGSCRVFGTVAPLIELGAGFDPDLTARENVFLNGTVLGMNPAYLREKFDEIVDFAELHSFLDVPVKNYSSGMVARLAFSIATVMDPDVLICDEILSVGDFLFREKCQTRITQLIEQGTTVLLVSHDIGMVEELCNRACWLSHGRIVAQGSSAGVVSEYKENARNSTELEKDNLQPPPKDPKEILAPVVYQSVKICNDGEELS